MTHMMTDRRLPLHDEHVKLGAKMADFAGWTVPVSYAGISLEHQAVRQSAGIFDVSHMGKVRVQGPGAQDYLEKLFTNQIGNLANGKARYGLFLQEDGGILDDLIVYREAEDSFFLIINAATAEKDIKWMLEHIDAGVELTDLRKDLCILALQGPASPQILHDVAGPEASALEPFSFRYQNLFGARWLIAATGYTGERGFELIGPVEDAAKMLQDLLAKGEKLGVQPAGFGARDTLRLEAAMLLYGQDMCEKTSPLMAGLRWTCAFTKDFLGKDALLRQSKEGLSQKLVGFVMTETGIARHDYPVFVDDVEVGKVTSGTHSPSLNQSIGLTYLPSQYAEIGRRIDILIRGRKVAAEICKRPFYRK